MNCVYNKSSVIFWESPAFYSSLSHGCLPTPTAHTLFSPPISKAYKYSTQLASWITRTVLGSNEECTYRKIPSLMTSFEMAACGKWVPCQRSRLMFDLTLKGRFAAAIAVTIKAARVTHNRISLSDPRSHYATKANLSAQKWAVGLKTKIPCFH